MSFLNELFLVRPPIAIIIVVILGFLVAIFQTIQDIRDIISRK